MDELKRDLKVEITADGSATIYVETLDEHYHSVKGALAESNHIYRDCAYLYRSQQQLKSPLRLLEIGFGTGLNAVVTVMVAEADRPVHYISLEKFPVGIELLEKLDYEKLVDSDMFSAIHKATWNQPVRLTPSFVLEKREADFLKDELPESIDIVYFDAFAPEKQPEMWSKESFERIYNVMNVGGVLTTYCSKGVIRRMLQEIGFKVERIPGPIGGKREVLRAMKLKNENVF